MTYWQACAEFIPAGVLTFGLQTDEDSQQAAERLAGRRLADFGAVVASLTLTRLPPPGERLPA